MSGLNLGEIRDALKAQLVANLSAETNVSARGAAVPPPSITIYNNAGAYDRAQGDTSADIEFLLLIDPGNSDESAVIRVDNYLSTGLGNNSSIADAVNIDPTLDGVVEDCWVKSWSFDRASGLASLFVAVMADRL